MFAAKLRALTLLSSLCVCTMSQIVLAQTANENAPAGAAVAPAEPAPAEPAPAKAAPAPTPAPTKYESAAQLSDQNAIIKQEEKKAPSDDTASWSLNAGGAINTGNTRSYNVNLGTRALLVRGMNSVSGDIQYVYGSANTRDSNGNFTGNKRNADNLNAQARYERFISHLDAAFVGTRFRRDIFAGLDARIQLQAGYQRHFFRKEKHRLWGEVGYDFTYDNLYPNPLIDPTDATKTRVLSDHQSVHSPRVFAGYENLLNEAVTFVTGIEFLYDIENSKNIRSQWVSELNSKLSDRFSLGLMFAARYDNVPVPGKEKLDTLTTINLIYSML